MYGFIVAACLRTQVHKDSLSNCLNSIRQFHENIPIAVVVDYTSEQKYVTEVSIEYPTVIFETNTPNVPADMLLLYYFKLKKYFQKAILLQDSMTVISTVDMTKTHELDYLWHFNNHRLHWHTIMEPETEFNKQNNIVTHDNLVEYCISNLIKPEDFKTYCIQNYHNKYKWSGCFGCLCIIDYDFLCKLDNEIKSFSIQNAILDKSGNDTGVNYSSREVKTIVDFMDKNQQYVQELKLCINAQVMLLINLDVVNGLANGSRGIIKDFSEKGYPIVLFMNGVSIEITPNSWYSDDNRIGRIQIPLKLAYAITIHKIQGATLDCALINLSNIFENGQAYVALSRVKSLDGLYISDVISEFDYSKIKACPKVLAFYGYI
jgi:hypothetical protein